MNRTRKILREIKDEIERLECSEYAESVLLHQLKDKFEFAEDLIKALKEDFDNYGVGYEDKEFYSKEELKEILNRFGKATKKILDDALK